MNSGSAFAGADSPERAEKYFQPQDFTDLQVLSQIAWFDEFFLQDPDIAALIKGAELFPCEDQRFVHLHQTRTARQGPSRARRRAQRAPSRSLLRPSTIRSCPWCATPTRAHLNSGPASSAKSLSPSRRRPRAVRARTGPPRESFRSPPKECGLQRAASPKKLSRSPTSSA